MPPKKAKAKLVARLCGAGTSKELRLREVKRSTRDPFRNCTQVLKERTRNKNSNGWNKSWKILAVGFSPTYRTGQSYHKITLHVLFIGILEYIDKPAGFAEVEKMGKHTRCSNFFINCIALHVAAAVLECRHPRSGGTSASLTYYHRDTASTLTIISCWASPRSGLLGPTRKKALEVYLFISTTQLKYGSSRCTAVGR